MVEQTYRIENLSNVTGDDDAGRIDAFLRARGIAPSRVAIAWNAATGKANVTVDADADPSTALQTYTSTPTAAEVLKAQALADAKPVIAAIIAKDRASRTPVERALLGLAVALRELTE